MNLSSFHPVLSAAGDPGFGTVIIWVVLLVARWWCWWYFW